MRITWTSFFLISDLYKTMKFLIMSLRIFFVARRGIEHSGQLFGKSAREAISDFVSSTNSAAAFLLQRVNAI